MKVQGWQLTVEWRLWICYGELIDMQRRPRNTLINAVLVVMSVHCGWCYIDCWPLTCKKKSFDSLLCTHHVPILWLAVNTYRFVLSSTSLTKLLKQYIMVSVYIQHLFFFVILASFTCAETYLLNCDVQLCMLSVESLCFTSINWWLTIVHGISV